MKKLFFVAAVALCATMVSCGSSNKAAEEVAEPVEEAVVEEVAVVDSVVADSVVADTVAAVAAVVAE